MTYQLKNPAFPFYPNVPRFKKKNAAIAKQLRLANKVMADLGWRK